MVVGSIRRAAVGAAFLTLIVTSTAGAAPVRVLEGEGMKASAGMVVREKGAAAGRALALKPRGVATATVLTDDVGWVVVRARSRRCPHRRRLKVSVDNGRPHAFTPSQRWRERRARISLPAGRHTVRIFFAGRPSRRCRALIDRLRLPAPPAAKPAPPAAVPAPQDTAAPIRRVRLGSSVQWRYFQENPGYGGLFLREYVSLTPENEMKMEWLQPNEGEWNFEAADRLVDFATASGVHVRGHALVFGAQTPPWVDRILFAQDAEEALRTHISTVMQRYKGRVRDWDVVNEALDNGGRYRPNAWYTKLGPRYVELAFRFAREADPTAKLYYNEFEADTAGQKRDATVALVRGLKEKGLIDGVGLQLHTSLALSPSRDAIAETMRIYEQMGLEVQVTEMDVLAGGTDALEDRIARQAQIFRNAAEACALVAACKRFTVWGVSDTYTWMTVDQMPLLLDVDGAPKPAMAAVREVIGPK